MTSSAPIFADDTTEIVNGQINLDAAIRVVVQGQSEQAETVELIAAGMANALTVDVVEPHDVENDQVFSGDVSAKAVATTTELDGSALVSATAVGNGATLIADSDLSMTSDQEALDGSTVAARARLENDSYAMISTTVASASANAVDTLTYGGETELSLRQDSGADVSADSYVAAPSGGLGWTATAASIASANTIGAQGYDQGPSQILDINQDSRGDVAATTRINAGGGGEMTIATAQANGNTARIQNEYAYGHMQGEQDNEGAVTATADVSIPHFDVDILTVSAEGVGNSALISNVGSNIYLGLDQTNNGAVAATANISGEDGGVGIANTTAFGNAATGYICSECPVTATGDMRQTNTADIRARTTITTNTGQLIGSAFAAGNSASYQTTTPN